MFSFNSLDECRPIENVYRFKNARLILVSVKKNNLRIMFQYDVFKHFFLQVVLK